MNRVVLVGLDEPVRLLFEPSDAEGLAHFLFRFLINLTEIRKKKKNGKKNKKKTKNKRKTNCDVSSKISFCARNFDQIYLCGPVRALGW